jgi:hypothetical protein
VLALIRLLIFFFNFWENVNCCCFNLLLLNPLPYFNASSTASRYCRAAGNTLELKTEAPKEEANTDPKKVPLYGVMDENRIQV